jgi:NAD-dependent SIR2 family protein deacetylase
MPQDRSPADLDASITRLAAHLRVGPLAVISGAGLSTASGIPAYRDRLGQWQHAKPIQHQEFLQSAAVRRRYWVRSLVGWPVVGRAAPTAGHRALSQLQQRGLVTALITQNVDGLHQKAGSREVLELHGGIDRVFCLNCAEKFPRARVQEWLVAANPDFAAAATAPRPDGDAQLPDGADSALVVPDCPSCGGILKPDVVFFGDSVPRDRVATATQAIAATPTLLIVGFKVEADCGEVLHALLEAVPTGCNA